MRLGLSSIVGDGFGTGSFGVDGVVSFPPAGSYNSTQFGIEYPVAEGGTDFANPVTSASVPNQVCDVDVLNDGSGGTYIDWSSATNVQYKAIGIIFYTDPTPQASSIEVPTGSGNYYNNGTYDGVYYHDGYGAWTYGGTNQSYYSSGTDTNLTGLNVDNLLEVPSGSGNFFHDGTSIGYTWDGFGGYNYPVTKGSFYSYGDDITYVDVQTEVPTGSNSFFSNGLSDRYDWDGNGGYYYFGQSGSYYSYGTYIYNDGSFDYYWDGNGGYYI